MENIFDAIQLVSESEFAFCHYITPNDVGATGGHQCGFHIAKNCYHLFFDSPGVKGSNLEKEVEITWQKDFITHSTAKYYGVNTRNEYRLTKYGRGFEFLKEEYIGSLLIMAKSFDGEISGYVLSDQDNIEFFISTFDLDVTVGNQVIETANNYDLGRQIANEFRTFIDSHSTFPDTEAMASFARDCVIEANGYTPNAISSNADAILLKWISAEYQLFRGLEEKIYRPLYSQPFSNCQSLIDFSNTILNRRKSRAGKSLEHHLAHIFNMSRLRFEEQAVTENKKKPDFIFPDSDSYHNIYFPADKLTMLGAKTTCKDRWRQVLTEADRIDQKHLFTLQCGVSRNQLQEMKDANLKLVVPRDNFHWFLPEYHENIMSLSDFIIMVKERQNA